MGTVTSKPHINMGVETEPANLVNNDFDAVGYVKRLGDLDKPIAEDNPLFLPQRPDNTPPENGHNKRKGPVRLPIPLSKDEKQRTKAEYYKSTQLPAKITLDTFSDDSVTEVLSGKAWVVPYLLSEEECEQLITAGEEWGFKESKSFGAELVRTSRRTDNWANEELSIKLNRKLPEDLLTAVENTVPFTSVRGIHPNWRVASYQQGETFPAHQDQADSVTVQHPEKVKQRFTSSHTLLIYLRRIGEQFEGGATRLFPSGSYTEDPIDICLPQGWGLVFQQMGLLHAGLPVEGSGSKYIAQAGLLRAEPNYVSGACAVFKYGPGLAPY